MKHFNTPLLVSIFTLPMLSSCFNDDFLSTLPTQSVIVPSSLDDFQQLLDNDVVFNGAVATSGGTVPGLAVAGTDEITFPVENQSRLTEADIQQFIWGDDPFQGDASPDWSLPYRAIYYANTILEGLDKIAVNNSERNQYHTIKGGALFHRAFAHYSLAQLFAQPYLPLSAMTDQGIPLRLTTDIQASITQASVKDTYASILADLQEAEPLLPDTMLYKTRPSKAALYALMARVYLTVNNWENALYNADRCLEIRHALLDYNKLPSTTAGAPSMPVQQPEVLFQSAIIWSALQAEVNPAILDHYETADLRKKRCFYKSASGRISFTGSYTHSAALFAGLAVDEVFLIKGECLARLGNQKEALVLVNQLRNKRYTPNHPDISIKDADDLMELILDERQRELYGRGLRWTDLRRFNAEGRNRTITHSYAGKTYTLVPNSAKYTWPIPETRNL